MRKFLLFTVAAFMTLALVQCTRTTDAARDLDTLYIGLAAAPQTLDPRVTTDATGMRLSHLLFTSLVRLGPNLDIVGEAAERWEYHAPSLTYRFFIRPGLKFSNGRLLTADDFTSSFSLYREPGSPFHGASKIIKSVKVMETAPLWTIEIALEEFSATFLTDLTPLKILPIAELNRGDVDFREKLIGSGPYELQRWTDQEIVLTKRPNPYIEPTMKYLVFKIVRDDTTRVQRMLRGELDVVQAEIPLDKVDSFRARPEEFQVFDYPGLSMTYMLVNLKDPTLSDDKVRKAIAHAVNPDEIITFKFKKMAERATSLLTPQNPYFHSGLESYSHDISKAKALLQELSKDTTLTLKTSNNPSVVDHARILSGQLDNAGITTRLQSFEWATFYNDISNGNFQLALMKWVGATDPDIYRIAFHSKELPPGRNRGSYINSDLDRLLDEGLRLEDIPSRKMHYQRIQEIVQDDLPIIPLWYEKQVAIAHSRVRNYSPARSGDFTGFMMSTKVLDK